jgi:hypothetical protein
MNIFDKILLMLETATTVMSTVPSPVAPFAGIALQLEKIVGAAIAAHAASTGKTVEEVIAGLHDIALIPVTQTTAT